MATVNLNPDSHPDGNPYDYPAANNTVINIDGISPTELAFKPKGDLNVDISSARKTWVLTTPEGLNVRLNELDNAPLKAIYNRIGEIYREDEKLKIERDNDDDNDDYAEVQARVGERIPSKEKEIKSLDRWKIWATRSMNQINMELLQALGIQAGNHNDRVRNFHYYILKGYDMHSEENKLSYNNKIRQIVIIYAKVRTGNLPVHSDERGQLVWACTEYLARNSKFKEAKTHDTGCKDDFLLLAYLVN